MEYLRKIAIFVLTGCVALGLLPQAASAASAENTENAKPASEYTWITDRELVDGSDYTGDPVLAQALNEIFDGNANIFSDAAFTKPVNTKLGSTSVPNNGVFKYVGNGQIETNVGTSCWIYANGVYFTLFGEATGCGAAGENSEKLDLSTTANRNFSYDNFTAWGVRPGVGALIRTQCGHSLIVLGYDSERLTILDGNGNGKGLVSIRVMTWNMLGFRASYIIQPKQAHVDALYPQDGGAVGTRTPGTAGEKEKS